MTLNEILDIVSEVMPTKIELSGRYGFEDPGTTGMVGAFIYSLYGANLPIKLNLQPVFVQQIFDIKIKADGDLGVFKLLKRFL